MLYQVILADPPWRYGFSKSSNRKIENHYSTMSLEDIKALKVPSADRSVLFLWATAPKLLEAVDVMKSWGFQYKTQAVWDKQVIGMGYWFRGQHELLLVGTKGLFSPPEVEHRISSVISARRGKHSKKPKEVHEWIEMAFPQASKLELFARETRDGWACWGDELTESTAAL